MNTCVWRLTIRYDGRDFYGWQAQGDVITVQEEVEKALTRLNGGERVILHGSGRTDAGVHALAQTASYAWDADKVWEPWRLMRALNGILPSSIRINDARIVENDFHARFCTTGKSYVYFLDTSSYGNPFLKGLSWNVRQELDVEAMKEAAKILTGKHDFSSFCVSSKDRKSDAVREVYRIEIATDGNFLAAAFTGSGFLYKMVRSLMGHLVDCGCGRVKPEETHAMLQGKDRSLTGVTAPAAGLYMAEVYYTKEELEKGLRTSPSVYLQRFLHNDLAPSPAEVGE